MHYAPPSPCISISASFLPPSYTRSVSFPVSLSISNQPSLSHTSPSYLDSLIRLVTLSVPSLSLPSSVLAPVRACVCVDVCVCACARVATTEEVKWVCLWTLTTFLWRGSPVTAMRALTARPTPPTSPLTSSLVAGEGKCRLWGNAGFMWREGSGRKDKRGSMSLDRPYLKYAVCILTLHSCTEDFSACLVLHFFFFYFTVKFNATLH